MKAYGAELAAFRQRANAGKALPDEASLKAGGLEAAARAFESMFIKMLLDGMPEPDDKTLSGGFGGGVWRDMLHGEYAEQAAEQRGFGIADAIMRQLGDAAGSAGSLGAAAPVSPLAGNPRVTSDFGPRIHPITGKHHHHTGVDWAAPVGAPVRAIMDAEVVFAGPRGGYGNMVELKHRDGTVTRYAHLDRIEARVGQRIGKGEQLGTVGSTGQSTGPHLHFEVRRDGQAINPTAYLQAAGAGQVLAKR